MYRTVMSRAFILPMKSKSLSTSCSPSVAVGSSMMKTFASFIIALMMAVICCMLTQSCSDRHARVDVDIELVQNLPGPRDSGRLFSAGRSGRAPGPERCCQRWTGTAASGSSW